MSARLPAAASRIVVCRLCEYNQSELHRFRLNSPKLLELPRLRTINLAMLVAEKLQFGATVKSAVRSRSEESLFSYSLRVHPRSPFSDFVFTGACDPPNWSPAVRQPFISGQATVYASIGQSLKRSTNRSS